VFFFSVNNEDTIAVNNSLCQPIEFIRDTIREMTLLNVGTQNKPSTFVKNIHGCILKIKNWVAIYAIM